MVDKLAKTVLLPALALVVAKPTLRWRSSAGRG